MGRVGRYWDRSKTFACPFHIHACHIHTYLLKQLPSDPGHVSIGPLQGLVDGHSTNRDRAESGGRICDFCWVWIRER